MHAVFIPWGLKRLVDILIRDLESQKLLLKMSKEGEEDKFIWLECQVRVLPGGIYDFVFPKEHADVVLTALRFNQPEDGPYSLNKEISKFGIKIRPLDELRKFLRLEPIPEFKTDKALVISLADVSIIPLGVRYDGEVVEPETSKFPGYTHEAI